MNTEIVWTDEVEAIDLDLIEAIEAEIAATKSLLSLMSSTEAEDFF